MAFSQDMIKTSVTMQYLKNAYRQVSNIRCTKFQNLSVSRFVLQVSLPTPLKPGAKLRMKM